MSIIAFAMIALLILFIGWKRGFFSLPSALRVWVFPIRLTHVIAAFAIYFAFSVFLSHIIGKLLQRFLFAHPTPITILSYAAWFNFINSVLIILSLIGFLFCLSHTIRKNIWLRADRETHLYRLDFTTAVVAWIIAFPLVVFVNQGLDWIITNVLHIQQLPEQLAVQFLKMTFGYPLLLVLAVLSIIVLAPLVEEILFRGFLQSFIRQHLGNKQAIFITSVLFAFFHYSPEQGIANLTIVGSLFVFSLFLGFVYEKRGSLWSPIALHSLFNAVNVANLYFLGEIPGGSL